MEDTDKLYVEVIVPLALDGCFTYSVPLHLRDRVKIGVRVEIEFGKSKKYSALVKKITNESNWQKVKDILEVLDENPIVTAKQLALWDWISDYYLCGLGEISLAALPNSYRLSSETIVLKEAVDYSSVELTDDEYQILEALEIRETLSIQDIQLFLMKKSVMRTLKSLMDRKLLTVIESLKTKNSTPQVKWIKLHPRLTEDKAEFNSALNSIQKNENQTRFLLSYLMNNPTFLWKKQSEIINKSKTSSSIVISLLKKEIIILQELDKFTYPAYEENSSHLVLSDEQSIAIDQIKENWKSKDVCLLKGVTGSGKTHIYIKLIQETIASGRQVLYLLPEIALTSQLVLRLRQHFGDQLLEYHSGIGNSNRLAIWNACLNNHPFIVGARSSIFLPFTNLGLIIIDEEHDQSYKQVDPAPRYNARDAALILAQEHQAKILLGSATPSIESYTNAVQKKYGLIELNARFGESKMPEIILIPLKEAYKFNRMKGFFSEDLLQEIESQLQRKKQILIFRNRRGYSPVLQCRNCNWEAKCEQCDIHLTLHKQYHHLKCHLCGLKKPIPSKCPQCSQHSLKMIGFGTEKIEEELSLIFPEINIQRFDLDAARSKVSQSQILEAFHEGDIQILVGTQMLTKGLDFDQVLLVGILQADQILFYPDFRAQERAFQLLTQVSGRSGRRDDLGKVIIQAFNVQHPVLKDVMNHDFETFYNREINERKKFVYPPFVRIVRIEIRHRKEEVANQSIEYLATLLKKQYGKRILGPADSTIARIKGYYAREIFIKIEKKSNLIKNIKDNIRNHCQELKNQEAWHNLRILIDVDPY